MKDAYSFHLTQESLQQTYESMYDTYCRILERLGLHYRAVEADTGAIGGSASHEFQVLADAGEDLIFYSDGSNYAANVEQATSLIPAPAKSETIDQLTIVDTQYLKTINEVSTHLAIKPEQMVKTLIVEGENDALVALVLRGDDELNEIKASKNPLVKSPLTFADEQTIKNKLNLTIGYLGPVNLNIPVIVDHQALAMVSFVCGANQNDKHFINAVWQRDAQYYQAWDLRNVKEGDLSPDGKGRLRACRGIEVGHVFQLGDKYAKAMQAAVTNENGQSQTMLMGCYGLGISRIVAAAIEQHHDERGIVWPIALAPFQLVIIPINGHRCVAVQEAAEKLYNQLQALGIDILLEDRNERPGVLFADSDLIGIPHRLVISEKLLQQQAVEYKDRKADEIKIIPLAEILNVCQQIFST